VIEEMWFVLVKDSEALPSTGYSHIALAVDKEHFETVAKSIEAANAKIWQENYTFGESIYFEDPDGHKLEIHSSTWQDRFEQELHGGKSEI
jgi:catechol 2,3-dioxygenase-like lactoylglutathione lyase family enzyme